MKIYELSDGASKEWIYANTIIEALKEYESITGNGLSEIDSESDIVEVPKEKWDSLTIYFPDDPDKPEMTFTDFVKDLPTATYMCSTEY